MHTHLSCSPRKKRRTSNSSHIPDQRRKPYWRLSQQAKRVRYEAGGDDDAQRVDLVFKAAKPKDGEERFYYLGLGDEVEEEDFLPQVFQVLQHSPGHSCVDRRHRVPKPKPNVLWVPGDSIKVNVERVLTHLLGCVMWDEPTLPTLPIKTPFAQHVKIRGTDSQGRPMLSSHDISLCMCLEHEVSCDWMHDGYMPVHFNVGHGVVNAHRFMLWALYGFHEDKSLCLHICGNKFCINPEHLVWGDAKLNKKFPYHEDFRAALTSQRRPGVLKGLILRPSS